MKLTINTEKLKDMVSKVIKGAGNDKLIPITQLMGIKQHGTEIVLTTTDATNYLYVSGEVESKSDFSVTVFAEQFSKLVSKLTSTDVSLEVKDNVLEVVGNGKYSIELPLNEEGNLIDYPDPIASVPKAKDKGTVKKTDIKTIIDTVKPSLATDKSNPEIMNYFVGKSVLATDSYKIANFDVGLFKSEYLISPELMDLLDIADTDSITYILINDSVVFTAGDIKIFGKLMQGDYPVDLLEKLLAEKFPSICKISKQDFLNLLDRISIFVSKYDEKAIRLYFEKDGITVSNKNRSSNEKIEYKDSKKHKDFDCVIDVEFLTTQIKAYASDVIELHYGRENSIKLVDGSITQIIALNEK